jgi:dTDP-4-amino-4,6-dideoxygalactose transaminase
LIPITKPFLSEEEAKAAHDAVLSGWVTQGPKVKEFEDAFARYVGTDHACAVSNCTTALHVALLAIGVEPGDVVITVSHSFIATANVVRHCFAEPVFIDIDPRTFNMDPGALERCLSEDCEMRSGEHYYRHADVPATGNLPRGKRAGRVAAILTVHQVGMPCDIARINEIAQRFHIRVVEDAACAIGSEISFDGGKSWEKIGRPHGDIACFSFHPRKVVTTGEGGMITTRDPELDAKFRLLRHHGMTVSDAARHSAGSVIFEEYAMTAFNYRMTDIQAAIGIEQLKKLDGIIDERRRLAKEYNRGLGQIEGFVIPVDSEYTKTNRQSYPLRISGIGADEQVSFMQMLLEKGISTRRGIMNSHQELPYRYVEWKLPESEGARDSVVLLPLYKGLGKDEQEHIIRTIKEWERNRGK